MNLKISNSNTNSFKSRKMGQNEKAAKFHPQNNQPSFTGLQSSAQKTAGKILKSAVSVDGFSSKMKILNDFSADEFGQIFDKLRKSDDKLGYASRIVFNEANDSAVILEDSIPTKLAKSAMYPIKDMWLDIASWALRGAKKVPVFSESAQKMLDSNVLSNRAKAIQLEDSFNIFSSAMSDISKKGANGVVNQDENAQKIFENLLKSQSKIKGNYKTADERTLNRIGTGLVSASIAGVDFYNISMLQNDNEELAKKAQKKRFSQESSRIFMNAGMSYLSLSALSKYTNKSLPLAAATIVGTTVVSETLSRILSKMPLHPISSAQAEKIAKGQQKAKEEEAIKDTSATQMQENKTEHTNAATVSTLNPNSPLTQASGAFSAFKVMNGEISKVQNQTLDKNVQFKGSDDEDDNKEQVQKDEPLMSPKNILKATGVVLAANAVALLARKSLPPVKGFMDATQSLIKKTYSKLTQKDVVVKAEDFNKMLDDIESFGLKKYATSFKEAFNAIVPEGITDGMVTIGKEDRKIAAPLFKALTHPFKFVWSVVSKPAKYVISKTEKTDSVKQIVEAEDLTGLKRTFDNLMIDAKKKNLSEDEIAQKFKEKIVSSLNSTGKSNYSNTKLAAISRPMVTLVASYFFVNDYRNEVLIASAGKDTEQAEVVTNERIMHKVSNFILNTMFMTMFNSAFNRVYNGSLVGATSVAMATEFTNERAIRASIGVPTKKMSKQEIQEHDKKNLERDDFLGDYYRFMSRLTGKKSLSQKAESQKPKEVKKEEEKD